MEKSETQANVETEALLVSQETAADDADRDAAPAHDEVRNARGLKGVILRLGSSRLP